MSATHKRLLPEPDRIPYFRNPSNPAPSVCAEGVPADRGERPVVVSLSALPVLTSEDKTCGASPIVRGRTLPSIAGSVGHRIAVRSAACLPSRALEVAQS